jgi:ABC-type phosphate transport system substrate-binding protein
MARCHPFLVAAILLCSVRAWAQVELVVIAHPSVTADSLDKDELLDYFTGDIQRWPDGTPVVVCDLGQKGKVRDGFYRFLGTRPSRMKSIWLRKMLSGEGDPPESLASEAEVLAHVAETPGALGYLQSSQVSDAVRVLLSITDDDDVAPDR